MTRRHFPTLMFPMASVFAIGVCGALTVENLRSFDT